MQTITHTQEGDRKKHTDRYWKLQWYDQHNSKWKSV